MKTSYLSVTIVSIVSMIIVACGTPAAPSPSKPALPTLEKPAKPTWQDRWESTVRAAKDEGTLTVYASGTNPATTKELKRAFREKYGIDIDFVVGRGAQLVARIAAERGAGLYLGDIIFAGGTTLLLTLKPYDILESLDPFLITPEVIEASMWRGKKIPFIDREHRAFAFVSEARTYFTVNTNAVKAGEIKSYRDALDPKWRGKIVIDDPTVSGLSHEWAQVMLVFFGEKAGKDYLENVVKQAPIVLRDSRLVVESLAKNKYPLAIGADDDLVSEFMAAGSPIRFVKMSEVIPISAGGGVLGLLKRAAHPNAATVFANWFLGKEGQTLWVKAAGDLSARLDVETTGVDPVSVPEEGGNLISVSNEEWYAGVAKRTEIIKPIFTPLLK